MTRFSTGARDEVLGTRHADAGAHEADSPLHSQLAQVSTGDLSRVSEAARA